MNMFPSRRENLTEPTPTPTPNDPARKRILVESEDRAERWAIESILRDSGFDVVACGGPHVLEGGSCPLVDTGSCSAVDAADAVFFRLNLPDSANEAVLAQLKRAVRTLPIVVEVPLPRVRQVAESLEGCQVLGMPATAEDIATAISRALVGPRSEIVVQY
jgi:hypothetical protein